MPCCGDCRLTLRQQLQRLAVGWQRNSCCCSLSTDTYLDAGMQESCRHAGMQPPTDNAQTHTLLHVAPHSAEDRFACQNHPRALDIIYYIIPLDIIYYIVELGRCSCSCVQLWTLAVPAAQPTAVSTSTRSTAMQTHVHTPPHTCTQARTAPRCNAGGQ